MYRLCLLNSIVPKIKPVSERLNAKTKNWYSDGYRASYPGTAICETNEDCEAGEICQAGYCAGLHRRFAVQGTFIGSDVYINPHDQYDSQDSTGYDYDYNYE